MNIERIAPVLRPTTHDRVIHSFIRRLAIVLTLKQWLIFTSVWCFAWGSVVLVMRAAGGVTRRPLLWGLVGVLLAMAAAAIMARKRLPARDSIRALLDGRYGCGGLLMASGDVPLGDWQSRIPEIGLPRLKWRGHQMWRMWGLFAASVVFIMASFMVPARYASINTGRTLDVGREVSELAEKIETLKEEQIIEETRAEALGQRLGQLGQEASGEDPARTWEALDHLAATVEQTAKDAAESAVAGEEKLARAETLTEGLMAEADRMDPRLMTEAMQTLSGMVESAIQENQMLAKDLPPEIRSAAESGALKPEHLKGLSDALGRNRSALNRKLSKLNRAGMIDAKSLKGGAQANRRGNAGLAQFLEENARRMPVENALEAWCSGRGGVDRGRGDAAMTWSSGTNEKGARFKERELPPSAVAGLKESQLVGLSAGAPTVENSLAAHGALNQAAKGGGSAYTQTILPRHRGAVKRYFERQQDR